MAVTSNGVGKWHITKKELSIDDPNTVKFRSSPPPAKEIIDLSFYPDDGTLSVFAALVYEKKIKFGVNIALKDFNKKLDDATKHRVNNLKLQDSWALIAHSTFKDDSYLGAAFWNKDRNQLVISHRGTINKINKKKLCRSMGSVLKSLLTDYEGIIQNKDTSQIHSACSFCAEVLKKFNDIRDEISITFTGHSLGAWLAQITGFCFEYLELKLDSGVFIKKENGRDPNNQIHIVAFDSPGCSEMMCEISEKYHLKYKQDSRESIAALDITIYFIIPNIINCINSHRGIKNLLQIMDSGRNLISFIDKDSCYNFDTHKIVNFVSLLVARDDTKIFTIDSWPSGSVKSQTLTSSSSNLQGPSNSCALWRNLVGGITWVLRYRFSRNDLNDEYKQFFQKCRKSIKEGNLSLRETIYEVHYSYSVEEFQYKKILKSAFSEKELGFLRNYEILRKFNRSASNFHTFLCENELEEENLKSFLPEFTIGENIKLILPLKEIRELFINRVKNIAVFLPGACQSLEEDSEGIKKHPNLDSYMIASDTYVKENLPKWKMNVKFEDTIELLNFLENPQRIFCLITEGNTKKEIFRIRNILSSSYEDRKPCFLDLIKLGSMKENRILVEDIFADPNCDFDSLLVIDCESADFKDQGDTPIKRLIGAALTLSLDVKKKLILVIPEGKELYEMFQYEILEKSESAMIRKVERLKFSDFDKSVQKQFLNEKIFILKNDSISLQKFLSINDPRELSDEQNDLLSDEHLLGVFLAARKIPKIELCSEKLFESKSLKVFMSDGNMSIKKEELEGLLKEQVKPRHYLGKHVKFLITGNFKELEKNGLDQEILKLFKDSEIVVSQSYEDHEKKFSQLCLGNMNGRVYWLQVSGDNNNVEIEVKKIFDSIFYIDRKFYYELYDAENCRKMSCGREISINTAKSKNLRESDLVKISDKIILLVADTGAGKTTVLRRLACDMKKKWLLYINLSKLNSEMLTEINEESVIDFLIENNRSKASSGIVKPFLRFSLKNKGMPIVLFFDEFDGLHGEAQEKIIGIFAYLKSQPGVKIWIATTTSMQEVLEEKLQAASLYIRGVDKNRRIEFVNNFVDARLLFHSKSDDFYKRIKNVIRLDFLKQGIRSKFFDENLTKYFGNCKSLLERLEVVGEKKLKDLFDRIKHVPKVESELNNQITFYKGELEKNLNDFCECSGFFLNFLSFAWSLNEKENIYTQNILKMGKDEKVLDPSTNAWTTYAEKCKVDPEIWDKFAKKSLNIFLISFNEMKMESDELEKEHLFRFPLHLRMFGQMIKPDLTDVKNWNNNHAFYENFVKLQINNYVKQYEQPNNIDSAKKKFFSREKMRKYMTSNFHFFSNFDSDPDSNSDSNSDSDSDFEEALRNLPHSSSMYDAELQYLKSRFRGKRGHRPALKEKRIKNRNSSLIPNLLKDHESLGFKYLFPEFAKAISLGSENIDEKLFEIGFIKRSYSNNRGQDSPKITFINSPFAEYFASNQIFEFLKKIDQGFNDYENFILKEVLIKKECKGIRRFLNDLLSFQPSETVNLFNFFGRRLPDLIKDFNEKGENEYLVNEDGKTALHVSLIENNGEITKKLLNSITLGPAGKRFIDIPDKWGATALFIAAFNKQIDWISKLLKFQPEENMIKLKDSEVPKILTYSMYNICLLKIGNEQISLGSRSSLTDAIVLLSNPKYTSMQISNLNTFLSCCVTNNWWDLAFKIMKIIPHITEVLTKKWENGFSILQLAPSNKQKEILDYLYFLNPR